MKIQVRKIHNTPIRSPSPDLSPRKALANTKIDTRQMRQQVRSSNSPKPYTSTPISPKVLDDEEPPAQSFETNEEEKKGSTSWGNISPTNSNNAHRNRQEQASPLHSTPTQDNYPYNFLYPKSSRLDFSQSRGKSIHQEPMYSSRISAPIPQFNESSHLSIQTEQQSKKIKQLQENVSRLTEINAYFQSHVNYLNSELQKKEKEAQENQSEFEKSKKMYQAQIKSYRMIIEEEKVKVKKHEENINRMIKKCEELDQQKMRQCSHCREKDITISQLRTKKQEVNTFEPMNFKKYGIDRNIDMSLEKSSLKQQSKFFQQNSSQVKTFEWEKKSEKSSSSQFCTYLKETIQKIGNLQAEFSRYNKKQGEN